MSLHKLDKCRMRVWFINSNLRPTGHIEAYAARECYLFKNQLHWNWNTIERDIIRLPWENLWLGTKSNRKCVALKSGAFELKLLKWCQEIDPPSNLHKSNLGPKICRFKLSYRINRRLMLYKSCTRPFFSQKMSFNQLIIRKCTVERFVEMFYPNPLFKPYKKNFWMVNLKTKTRKNGLRCS